MRPEDLRYQLHRARHAFKRRLLARRIDHLYQEILARWDQQAFIERFRKYWDPFASLQACKFLDLNVWFKEAIFRYLWIDVPRIGKELQVVDLGAGTGYFLMVCRHMGHRVLGLDLETEPVYNECFEFFELPRVVHRIEPMKPLPDLSQPADLVTAFMTSFNQYPDETPWGPEPWQFFLEDLRGRLSDRGRAVFKFNLNPKTGEFYSREVCRAIKRCRRFRAKFSMDYLFLFPV